MKSMHASCQLEHHAQSERYVHGTANWPCHLLLHPCIAERILHSSSPLSYEKHQYVCHKYCLQKLQNAFCILDLVSLLGHMIRIDMSVTSTSRSCATRFASSTRPSCLYETASPLAPPGANGVGHRRAASRSWESGHRRIHVRPDQRSSFLPVSYVSACVVHRYWSSASDP